MDRGIFHTWPTRFVILLTRSRISLLFPIQYRMFFYDFLLLPSLNIQLPVVLLPGESFEYHQVVLLCPTHRRSHSPRGVPKPVFKGLKGTREWKPHKQTN